MSGFDDDVADDLLRKSAVSEWERLPDEGIQFTVAEEPAQLTLRLSSGAVEALKKVARRKLLPYHSLARSWLAAAVESGQMPRSEAFDEDTRAAADKQLNLKLPSGLLTAIKRAAHEREMPYHRLARLWLYDAIRAEASATVTASVPAIALKEILLLLLFARGRSEESAPVVGVTRLTKLLFVVTQKVGAHPAELFYAYNFGPFTDEVYDARDALRAEDLLEGGGAVRQDKPSFDDMMAVVNRWGRNQQPVDVYRLSPKGKAAAERLLRDEANRRLFKVVEAVKQEYGEMSVETLVERVYEEYPEYTDKSLIAEEVRQRREARKKRG